MFFNFILKKVTVTVLFEYYPIFLGAGAGFKICLEPEPENQKRTGSGNAGFYSAVVLTDRKSVV